MQKLKWKLATLLMIFAPVISFAQEQSDGIDQTIDRLFKPLATALGNVIFFPVPVGGSNVPIVLFVLIGGAIFFTIYFKFVNFTLIGKAIKVVKGDYDDIDKHGADIAEGDSTPGEDIFETIKVEGAEGEESHFQALTAALSATVGLGNIAGVLQLQ